MKRITISLSDNLHAHILSYAKANSLTISGAVCVLTRRGINEKTPKELSELVMNRFHDNNVHCFIEGSFTVPEEVISDSIEQAIDESQFDSLSVFAHAVGA